MRVPRAQRKIKSTRVECNALNRAGVGLRLQPRQRRGRRRASQVFELMKALEGENPLIQTGKLRNCPPILRW